MVETDAVLEELLAWVKFATMPRVVEALDSVLSDKETFLAYENTDGRTQSEVAAGGRGVSGHGFPPVDTMACARDRSRSWGTKRSSGVTNGARPQASDRVTIRPFDTRATPQDLSHAGAR